MAGDILQEEEEDLSVLVLLELLLEEEAVGEGEMLSLARMLAMENEPLEVSELDLEVEEVEALLLSSFFLPASSWEVMMGAEIWACSAKAGVKLS